MSNDKKYPMCSKCSPLLCLVNILVTQLQQEAFIEQSRQTQRETEDLSSLWQLYVCLYVCNPPSQPDKQEPVHGFERKVTITVCDLGIFLRARLLACKTGKS